MRVKEGVDHAASDAGRGRRRGGGAGTRSRAESSGDNQHQGLKGSTFQFLMRADSKALFFFFF